MKQLHRHTLTAFVLAVALAVSLPSAAGAKSEGHGKRGRGHSSEARSGHSGKRDRSRVEPGRTSVERPARRGVGRADRSGSDSRERAVWRSGGGLRSGSRDRASGRGGSSRGEVRYRNPQPDARADARWRDSGTHEGAPSYGSRTYYRDGGRSHSRYRPRYYYNTSFHRPRFAYRSGFALGFVIGSVPGYGYRYFDPYCDMGFSDLDVYYDHCYDHGHPDAILVVDVRSGYPIASCAYHDGYWVVDDCY